MNIIINSTSTAISNVYSGQLALAEILSSFPHLHFGCSVSKRSLLFFVKRLESAKVVKFQGVLFWDVICKNY
jgi:hypothetical protein